MTVHASAVAIGGRALLLLGAPGCGKSDLALRLIDRGATLIADDRVRLDADGDRLLASPPPALAGLLEVRGVGIVTLAWMGGVPVELALALDQLPERLPARAAWHPPDGAFGRGVPYLALTPFDASAPRKAEMAMGLAAAGRLWSHDND